MVFWLVREGFLIPIGSSGNLFAAIDRANRPEIYFRHVEEGRFIVRSGHSSRRGKSKLLSFRALDNDCLTTYINKHR